MGDYHNGQRQTVRFIITEKPDANFTRDGNDLKTVLKLSFKESLLGFDKEVTTISDAEFVLAGQPQHNQVLLPRILA